MGILRFLFGLMGMSNATDQDSEMSRMSEDQFQDELMQQRDREWDEDMKKDDEI